MRTPEHGYGATRSAQRAQCVRELSGLCKRPDEHDVAFVRDFLGDILSTGVTHQCDVMSFLFTPDREDLGHDAGEVGIHDAAVQASGRSSRDEIDDADLEFSHSGTPGGDGKYEPSSSTAVARSLDGCWD